MKTFPLATATAIAGPPSQKGWGPLCYSNNKFFGVEIRVTANRGYMPLTKQMECLDIFLNSRSIFSGKEELIWVLSNYNLS